MTGANHMKKLLTLAGSLIVLGSCATGSFPEFPSTVKNHYVTEVRSESYQPEQNPEILVNPELTKTIINLEDIPIMEQTEVVRCLKFEIVSKHPYKIKYISQVETKECNGVGGYKTEDSISIYNWMDDVAEWAEGRKKCFK